MSHRIPMLALAFALALVQTARADIVTDWNLTAVQLAKDAKLGPNPATRVLAIVHIGIHDALAVVDKTDAPYSQGLNYAEPVSREAAALGAAHYALSVLFPASKPALNLKLNAALANIPKGAARTNGLALGQAAADAILQARSGDGALGSETYPGSNDLGKWRPTPPSNAAALEPFWRSVKPFALTSADQFRPAAPPDIATAAYATDYEEVRKLGAKTGSTRSDVQTQIAKFWEFATHIPFNAIARQLSKEADLSLADNARLFAQLNVALADSRVAAWDAKYTYGTWRPVTAIVSDDGNDGTTLDAVWTPDLDTPAHPEYPSGHSTTGAAGATILQAWFGDENAFSVSSDSLPEVTRSFTSLSQAALENGRSRIYGGIHFSYANNAGLALGQAVANQVLATQFLLLPPPALEDAGVADAGSVEDAGRVDAGAEAAVADAGADDATPDASVEPDAGKDELDAGATSPEPVADAGRDEGKGEPELDAGADAQTSKKKDSSCSLAFGSDDAPLGGVLLFGAAMTLARRRRRMAA